MPRVSDWPPQKPPRRSYAEVVADVARRQAAAARARERRTRDVVVAVAWLLGAFTVVGVVAFIFF